MTFTSRNPKSFYVFIGAIALGLFVFVPLAFAGLSLRGIPWFLTGMAGAGLSWLVAAFVGMYLASRGAQGHYETLRPASWREQVWVLLVAIAAPLVLAPQHAEAQPYPLARSELRACMDRDDALTARQDRIEASKRDNDAEGDAIARAGERLAEDLRRLDPANAAAIEAHNARTVAHNHRVEVHNRRVSDMNAAAAALNGDQADMTASCGTRSFYTSDRDAILRERGWR
jgi:hypothetical protein